MSETRSMTHAALIVAAGRGTRAGGDIPKQWQRLGEKRVIDWTIDAFRKAGSVNRIVVVLHPDDLQLLQDDDLLCVKGGASRAASVRAGLEALASDTPPDTVLIHDAARATLPAEMIDDMTQLLETHEAVAPGLAVTDALWSADGDQVAGTVDRSHLWRAQTPQCFHFRKILDAHRASDGEAADDVEIARAAGMRVHIGQGHPDNLKITTPADFDRAARILETRTAFMDIRVGNGFDVHRFGPGDHVMLCGVAIPFERGLQGHSDADVGLHTITDAIYGALSDGDIGTHFPPSDPQWKGAESDIFLVHAVKRARERGYAISNIDCTIICEVPKIGPHATALRQRVSEITEVTPDRISIKATTTERLGFTGRGEGIAAMATVTLVTS